MLPASPGRDASEQGQSLALAFKFLALMGGAAHLGGVFNTSIDCGDLTVHRDFSFIWDSTSGESFVGIFWLSISCR